MVLWDIEKFFDSISPVELANRLIRSEAPIEEAALALQMHSAPRRIGGMGRRSRLIKHVGAGVVAGCASSTSCARSVVSPAIKQAEL